MKQTFAFIAMIVVAILGCWFVYTAFFLSEESKVMRVVEKGRRAFESGSALSISGILSNDYSDPLGLDKPMVLQSLMQLYDSTEERSARLMDYAVNVNGESATAQLSVMTRLKANQRFNFARLNIGNDVSTPLDVHVKLQKEKKRWKILGADVKLANIGYDN